MSITVWMSIGALRQVLNSDYGIKFNAIAYASEAAQYLEKDFVQVNLPLDKFEILGKDGFVITLKRKISKKTVHAYVLDVDKFNNE